MDKVGSNHHHLIIIKLLPLLFLLLLTTCPDATRGLHEDHGPVKMGVKNASCDDGETKIELDIPNPVEFYHICEGVRIKVDPDRQPKEECINNEDIPPPTHLCMQTPLEYKDIPPRGGPHRPIWPVYGEYYYLPPGRWVHAMEHGAVVYLYDPCANEKEVEKLKNIVRNCIRKHVITPSEMLTKEHPMALLTWGCRLEMSHVDETKARQFIKRHAMDPNRTNEYNLSRDGGYKHLLVSRAAVVGGSDFQDSNVCP